MSENIQDLLAKMSERIEELENRVEKLENQVDSLETRIEEFECQDTIISTLINDKPLPILERYKVIDED